MQRYEGVPIRIASLPQLADTDVLDGAEFDGCQIIGPAVLAILNNVTIAYSGIDGDFDSTLWEIPMTRQRIIGAIGIQNCRFTRCNFVRIGFAGPAAFVTQFRSGFTQPAPAPVPPAPQKQPPGFAPPRAKPEA
jgi:hypothetical protein